MGGGYYDRDVGMTSLEEAVAEPAFTTAAAAAMSQNGPHVDLMAAGRFLACTSKAPIVVAMDVTRSRGNDSKIVYDKMPMLYGQIMMQGYLEDPAISFAAIGDAAAGDRAPLQVGDFASGTELDEWLTKIWLEEGGGGTGRESYELAAFFYARRTELTGLGDGKGIFFFTGDEGFYPEVTKEQIAQHIVGDPDSAPAGAVVRRFAQLELGASSFDTKAAFRELCKKFHVFFIYPRKALDERRSDIDAEISARLRREGGKTGDVRVSLVWNNRNDCDLHVIAPSGEEVYYGHKKSICGGELDVDMNVRGESTKPVENIYWPPGGAPAGRYKVVVQNYAYHDPEAKGVYDFRVEVVAGKKASHHEGKVGPKTGKESNVTVCEFDFSGLTPQQAEQVYASYGDGAILAQWQSVLPRENILVIDDPKAVVDAMLGAIALVTKKRDLEGYLLDMQHRLQTDERIEAMRTTLGPLAAKHSP